ncbi:MAG TPA: hypothetical protein VEB66_10840 [Opitutaceae bacterium]|nr:hypothetical protein [Opitutaceae bacterium]
MNRAGQSIALSIGLLLGPVWLHGSRDALTTAISGMVHRGHLRQKGDDGKWRREEYVLLMGGQVPGTIADASVRAVDSPTLAGAIVRELARQNYHFAPDSQSARLLILAHWGKTVIRPHAELIGTVSPSSFSSSDDLALLDFQQEQLDKEARRNAELLGLGEAHRHPASSWMRLYDNETLFGPRYYVILSAYDLGRVAAGEKKLLWRTRMSMSAYNDKFDDKFMQMLASASRHFGQATSSMIQQYSEPEVIIGTPEVLGIAPALPPRPAPEPARK